MAKTEIGCGILDAEAALATGFRDMAAAIIVIVAERAGAMGVTSHLIVPFWDLSGLFWGMTGGYTPREDEKSAQEIDCKGVVWRP